MTLDPSKVRELLEAATPGPWHVERDPEAGLTNWCWAVRAEAPPAPIREICGDAVGFNASLIAACPDIARAYLEAVERVEVLEREHEYAVQWCVRATEAEARIAALEEGLRKYGRHGNAGSPCSGPCAEWQTGERSCTCGLDALLAAKGDSDGL